MTKRPTRATPSGRAYLDLRKAASAARRPTDELLHGLELDPTATSVEAIRDDESYGGARVTVHGSISTAVIQFHVDVNIGDPLWPPPGDIDLPRVLGGEPIRVRGYSVELVLAEKIVTAMQRGTANTRWRDFLDIASLARRDVDDEALVESISRVAAHRQAPIWLLGEVLTGYAPLAQGRWAAWRRKQRLSDTTPESFVALLDQVLAFADPLLERASKPR